MPFRRTLPILLVILCSIIAANGQSERRSLKFDDLFRIKNVGDPQVSPDGQWVAYVVSSTDVKADKSDSEYLDGELRRQDRPPDHLFDRQRNTRRDGARMVSIFRLCPRGRGRNRGSQVWILDRNGGEARQLTEIKGRLQSYEWSPDSKRMAMVIGDPDPDSRRPARYGGRCKTTKADRDRPV